MKYNDFFTEYERLEQQAINYAKAYVDARIELLKKPGEKRKSSQVDVYYSIQDISGKGISVLAEWPCMGGSDREGHFVPIEVLSMNQEQQNEHAKQKAEKDIAEEQGKEAQKKEARKQEAIANARRTLAHYGEK